MEYIVHIPNWRPHTTNELLKAHWRTAGRLKSADAQMIGTYCNMNKVPRAEGRRSVSITMTCAQGRSLDQDAVQKSCLDALVVGGYLVDDSVLWMYFLGVTIERGKQRATTIRIADIP